MEQRTCPRILSHCVLRPADVPPRFEGFEVVGTFNPAVIEAEGGFVFLIRVCERPTETRPGLVALPRWDLERDSPAIDWTRLDEVEFLDPRLVRSRANNHLRLTFLSWILVGHSRDGLTIDRFGPAMPPATRYETFGIEDPRLTKIDDRYYFTYVAVSEHGIATALASTSDFQTFERHGIIFPPENKDVVLFPEKIDGRYVAMHRPNPNGQFTAPEIWLSQSPDLLHWGRHRQLLGQKNISWATAKIGGGTPPVRTGRGWLSLVHGNIKPDNLAPVGQYAAATLLLGLDDPSRIVGLSPGPVMVPETDFEREGYLPDIVFPTALIIRGDEAHIYYGAADAVVGVAHFALKDLLATV